MVFLLHRLLFSDGIKISSNPLALEVFFISYTNFSTEFHYGSGKKCNFSGGGQKCLDARRPQTREEAYFNGTLTKRVCGQRRRWAFFTTPIINKQLHRFGFFHNLRVLCCENLTGLQFGY